MREKEERGNEQGERERESEREKERERERAPGLPSSGTEFPFCL